MDFDQLYPKRFMKAGEFNGRPVTLTIASVKLEELGEGNEKKGKAVVAFKGTKKEWVANVTNGTCLKAMFGRKVDDWIGKRVTLYPVEMPDPFTGELILGIRVKGSPDIAEDISFSARLGRKQASFKLFKTAVGNKKAPEPPPEPEPEPGMDLDGDIMS